MATFSKPTAVSLFSGAGGMSEGFRQAGFEIILAVETSPNAASTFCLNHADTPFILSELSHLERENMASTVIRETPDVVFGGPPCQGFSVGGPRDPKHPSNRLIWDFVEFVRYIKPLTFVMENVPGLVNVHNGVLIDQIVRALEGDSGGYNVRLDILDAAHFGVPQFRRRVFLVGTRPGINFQFPLRTHFPGTYVTVAQAISDLPVEPTSSDGLIAYPTSLPETEYQRERRNGSHVVFNHNCKRFQRLRHSRIGHLQEGDTKRAIPEPLQPGGRDSKYRRLHSDRPSPTITAHMAKDSSDFIHPWLPRPITVREGQIANAFTVS